MGMFDWFNSTSDRPQANTANQRMVMITGTGTPSYVLNNQYTLNNKFIRQLYQNKNNDYALSGHLVKPIINANINFIGKPRLLSNDDETEAWLRSLDIPFRNIHKYAESEGTVFLWPQWDSEESAVVFQVITSDKLQKRLIDPASKKTIGYIFKENLTFNDKNGISQTTDIAVKITAEEMSRSFSGLSAASQTFDNPFNFIPIVEFHNDKDVNSDLGNSEIQNVEPLLKYYHDITMEAAQAQKNDGHPKMQLSGVKDIQAWVTNNFGEGVFDNIVSGKATIRMQDRDFFLNQTGEKVEYVTKGQVTGDYKYMSEVAFTNLVEGSETPEVMFGANLGTSLASVKEQRPIWIKKIESKQDQYNTPWEKALNMARIIYEYATLKQLPGDIILRWQKPEFTDEKEKAETFKIIVEALQKLKLDNAISNEEYHATLRKFDILELEPEYDKHAQAVDDSVVQDKERAAPMETEEIENTLRAIRKEKEAALSELD